MCNNYCLHACLSNSILVDLSECKGTKIIITIDINIKLFS